MKSFFSIAVWMMVLSVFVKMLVFATGSQFESFGRYALFANIFFLLMGIFLGIRLFKKSVLNQSKFLDDFKAGMKVAAFYSILMSAFVYVYYSFIDTDYFTIRLANQMEVASENGMNLEQVRQTGEFFLTPFFQTTITLMGFLLLGSFYAAILTFLMRKMRGFGH